MTVDELPEPECSYGYPDAQLRAIFDEQELRRLWLWLTGQTGAICDGRRYDYERKEYEPTECAASPHGPVVYEHDVRRWMTGGRIID